MGTAVRFARSARSASRLGLFLLAAQLFGCDTRVEGQDEATNTTTIATPTAGTNAGGSAGSSSAPTTGGSAGQTLAQAGGASGSAATTSGGGGAGGAANGGAAPAVGGGTAGGQTPADGGGIVITPDDGVLRILPLGDSITLGAQGGYRNDLYTSLVADGLEVDMIGTQYDTSTEIDDKDHEGHPGFTIGNAREYVDGWLDTITVPNVVLIMLGTNDVAWWTTKTPSETKDALIEFVDHLLGRLPEETVLVVATIPPQSSANVEPINMDRAEMTVQYNSLAKTALAAHAAYGSRVFTADVNAVLTMSDLYDGIHPSREAHTKVAAVFYDVMKNDLGL